MWCDWNVQLTYSEDKSHLQKFQSYSDIIRWSGHFAAAIHTNLDMEVSPYLFQVLVQKFCWTVSKVANVMIQWLCVTVHLQSIKTIASRLLQQRFSLVVYGLLVLHLNDQDWQTLKREMNQGYYAQLLKRYHYWERLNPICIRGFIHSAIQMV